VAIAVASTVAIAVVSTVAIAVPTVMLNSFHVVVGFC
jgi:hypothetical protein